MPARGATRRAKGFEVWRVSAAMIASSQFNSTQHIFSACSKGTCRLCRSIMMLVVIVVTTAVTSQRLVGDPSDCEITADTRDQLLVAARNTFLNVFQSFLQKGTNYLRPR